MLTSLQVTNFAIVEHLDIEWQSGMTTITGETGAGKSIAIDALSLCLGERAEASMVREGADKAQVSAVFDIQHLPAAKHFINEHELGDNSECVIRRVVAANGRSKAFINGVMVPAGQLKTLGNLLISIHGQHAHQQLNKANYQLSVVDSFAGHTELLNEVKTAYNQLQSLEREQKQLAQTLQQAAAEKQLLEYQVAELDEFALATGEYEEIEQQHTLLSNANSLLEGTQKELQIIYQQDNYNAYSMVQSSANQIAELASLDKKLAPIADLLFEAGITLEEAARELSHYQDSVEMDPSQLSELDERISRALDLARKHDITPEELPNLHAELQQSLANIEQNDERFNELEAEIVKAKEQYYACAGVLSESRSAAAKALSEQVTKSLVSLSMENAKFAICIEQQESVASSKGSDTVDFQVAANTGQRLQPLHKVASGGELSRISLAIEVIIADKMTTPTLIFDEVDVGISGPTASAVGKLLRQLGKSTQVICVTHLPQVASSGHNQFFVSKTDDGKQTNTRMAVLDNTGRIDEIARLLGGTNISDITRTNASELLSQYH
ncbi:DNA repair protein RecN [Pseudoalteromonas sp. SSM20]|uniref:DNA repair protein RecN n=1 Tax=Pseudoalteromonas sp. SSM20 TaxID=3139394 RepID=UPI003BA8C136